MRLPLWPFLLLFIFGAVWGTACDDSSSNNNHDAGPDVDIIDAGDDSDISDADADVISVDCDAQSECVPWEPTEGVPPEYNIRIDDLACDDLFSNIRINRTGFGNYYSFDCYYQPAGVTKGQTVLMNLDTLDASPISPSCADCSYYNSWINGNWLVAEKFNYSSPGNDIELHRYRLTSDTWSTVLAVPGADVGYPMITGTGGMLYLSNEGSSDSGNYSLNYYHLETNDSTMLEELEGSIDGYFTGDELIAWSVYYYKDGVESTTLKVADPATWEVRTIRRATKYPIYIYPVISKKHVVFDSFSVLCGKGVYNLKMYDWESDVVTDVKVDRFWDTPTGYAFRWPLIAYADHSVACSGYVLPGGAIATNASYLVLHDLETGVRRPLPIPLTGLYDLEGMTITHKNELIYRRHPNFSEKYYYLLNLYDAGFIDEEGHVIPDPTFPTTDATP
ncbi:hypothetical protein KKF84_04220 [Myxococcota bacterium]|nr:hypothetical protein [Myxococcota bacterium]